ncbi:MAG: 1-acyl-sn-glycerol-3-phosphate acyltransferase [Anaerolineales bacterium]|nr:1-acyl-sn-glycerol-3-phosphate acyltransferase [Anaerolineales bacterium]
MQQPLIEATTLRRSILDDLFKDFDHSRKIWIRKALEPLVWISAHRFAGMVARFDENVAYAGFREAVRQFLSAYVSDIDLVGREHIPEEGPLLIVSNHPGTYDSLAIAASLPRDDLNIIATNYPLLQMLPATSQHLIFTNPQIDANISLARSTVRHLQSGGAVLIFPRGRVEPDPANFPNALDSLQAWSTSLDLFLRKVPQTKVVVTIVSGVLSPIFIQNPLIKLWQGIRDPLAIAEVTQVITQMIFKKWVQIQPQISFNLPLTLAELQEKSDATIHPVVAEARQLMIEHLSTFQPSERA